MATRKRETTTKPESKETARPQLEFTATKICEQPVVPVGEFTPDVGPERASPIRNSDRKWANGTKLHYCFMTSPAAWAGSNANKQKAQMASKPGRTSVLGSTLKRCLYRAMLKFGSRSNETPVTGRMSGAMCSVSAKQTAR